MNTRCIVKTSLQDDQLTSVKVLTDCLTGKRKIDCYLMSNILLMPKIHQNHVIDFWSQNFIATVVLTIQKDQNWE